MDELNHKSETMPKTESAKKIKDLDIDEISLVDRAANRRKFAITKKERREMFEKIIEILKNWLTEEEITEEFQAGIKELPEDVQKAHLATLTVLEEYNDEDIMPAEFKKALTSMVKATVTPATEKKDGEDELTLDIFIEKAGAVFSKATKAQIEKVISSLQALLGADDKTEDKKKEDNKNLTPEQIAALEKAEAIIAAEEAKERKAKEDKEKARDDALDKMAKEIAELKKQRGTSKQLDGKDEDEKDEKKKAVVDKFPSLKLS